MFTVFSSEFVAPTRIGGGGREKHKNQDDIEQVIQRALHSELAPFLFESSQTNQTKSPTNKKGGRKSRKNYRVAIAIWNLLLTPDLLNDQLRLQKP